MESRELGAQTKLAISVISNYNVSNEQLFYKNRHISLHLRHIKNARTMKWQMNWLIFKI